MGLRIRTNAASLAAQRNLEKTRAATDSSLEKLSSGYRINKAADDAAGLAISENLKAKVSSLHQAKRNASDGVSMVQVVEGSLNEVSNILIRLRELATQAASDTISNRERNYVNREYQQLVGEIDRISNSTEFNGLKLLRGEEDVGIENLTIHVGAGDGRAANTDTIDISVRELRVKVDEDLGLASESEIGPSDPEEGFVRETAAQKLNVLDTALGRIANTRAVLGAKQSRLTSTIENLGIQIENMESANSRVRDVDFAAESAEFTQQRILTQAGVSVLAQANSAPEVAVTLLR